MTPISVVIITKNEAANIERCIRSVAGVADEVVVIDACSEDETVQICTGLGAKVLQRPWEGYAQNKNFGNMQAAHDFILSMDADEALSPALREAILGVKNRLEGVYSFNRLANYCGKWIYHCGWYPDVKTRLFDRRLACWEGDFVHETLQFSPQTPQTHLPGDLLHYTYTSISDHLLRLDRYTELAARELHKQNRRTSLAKLLFGPPGRFFKSYVLQKGFLDGFYGFVICAMSAFYVFVRQAKAISMKKNEDLS